MGDDYTDQVRQTYAGRVPGGADLVCYWFEKARAHIESGQAQRAGLVATNSIRGGTNRKVLERIQTTGLIFNAWSDEDWVNEGAAVRVSLVCFGNPPAANAASPLCQRGVGGILNGQPVQAIHADLTSSGGSAGGVDLTQAKPLAKNARVCFIGTKKAGAFDVSSEQAQAWLSVPNPHGRPNSDVLFPWINGKAIVAREPIKWIICFAEIDEQAAALYEKPFEYIRNNVYAERQKNREERARLKWWLHRRPATEMRETTLLLPRYIATPRVSKFRLFAWVPSITIPDDGVYIFARSDDTTFGILHSRFHELWALRLGTSLEDRPRYTPTTCFETFPFPDGLQPNQSALSPTPLPQAGEGLHIADAAQRLNELRENWLNPPQWIDRVPEIVPGYPDRLIPKPEYAAELKKRTLTNLYNARPTWLANAHRDLDNAVAAAYGWPVDLSDEEILRRLLALNQARAVS